MNDEQKTENFETLTEKLNNSIEDVKVDNPDPQTTPLYCPHCEWKTHPGSKDKARGLKNHIRVKHPEHHNKKKSCIVIEPPKVQEIVETIETEIKDEDIQQKLIGDLDLLKVKFSQIPFNWNYNLNSSVNHLQRQKALFLRVLNDEAGTDAIFNLLVISSKALEKVADASNVANINGYADDVKTNRQEIYPILKNMVDTGALSVEHLSPELRLGMIMTSLAINRLETNKIQKNNFLDEEDGEML
tara:strand:+ start:599 stop:1330 length:732 start_codon:yes stop_codon:yes gene_type:complete